MAGTLAADPQQLAAQAAHFRAAADTARQAAQRLQSQLDSIGNAWGEDEVGAQFAKLFVPQRKQLMEGTHGAEAMLTQLADGLVMAAQAYEQAERNARRAAS